MASKGLSIKQQKYKKNRILGMSRMSAARAAGYSEIYCKTKSYLLDRSEKLGMQEYFERAGLTDKKIVEHALAGLNATKEIIIDGEKCSEAPEWNIRHKYFETILKMCKKLDTVELEKTQQHIINIVNCYGEKADNDSSRAFQAEPIRIRDLGQPGALLEHKLAPAGAENNAGAQ